MRALVKEAKGPGLTELRERPVPEVGPGDALIRVSAAAVCASDVHIYRDRFMYEPPLVLGHEFSWLAASLAEPLAVAVHAVEDRGGIEKGDTVVVLGPGAVGLLAAEVARAEGAARVVVAGTDKDVQSRFPCAEKLGFETVNVNQDNLLERVMSHTNGQGADVVVEAAGSGAAVAQSIALLRRAGRLIVSGITGEPTIPVAWDALTAKGATVCFSYSSRPRNWIKAMKYLSDGAVLTEPLITHRLPLARWREAFELMERQECIRTVLEMAPEKS